jgi:hypothetical protein
MHFSQGQIIFIIVFVAGFAIALTWAYRRDRATNKKHFSGTWKVLITVIIVLAALSWILRLIQ